MTQSGTILEERVITALPTDAWWRWLSLFYWISLITDDVRMVYRARYVLRNLIVTQLKIRYHRSSLGFFWTLLNPVLMLTVQAVVFSHIVNIEHYSVYLFAGFIPWQYLMTSIDNGSRSMLSSEGLIRKIAAPKILFPLADVVVCLINMAFAMTALFVMFVFLGAKPSVQLVLIPVGTLLLTMFAMGLVFVSMSLTTFFRDFLHLIPIFLQAWYFASPIMYQATDLQKVRGFGWIVLLNPLTYFLSFFHYAIFYGPYEHRWPTSDVWIISSVLAVVSLAAGYAVYKKLEHEYIFRL